MSWSAGGHLSALIEVLKDDALCLSYCACNGANTETRRPLDLTRALQSVNPRSCDGCGHAL